MSEPYRCSWETLYEAWVDAENGRDAAVKAERERVLDAIEARADAFIDAGLGWTNLQEVLTQLRADDDQ